MRINTRILLFVIALTSISALRSWGQQLMFNHFNSKDGLPHSIVKSIYQDKYRRMWFGTGNGLAIYDGIKFTTYLPDKKNVAHSLPGYIIGNITGIDSNNIAISTNNGVAIYNIDKDEFQNLAVFTFTGEVEQDMAAEPNLVAANDSIIWCQKSNKLYRMAYQTKHVKKYTFEIKNAPAKGGINTVLSDKNQNLYVVNDVCIYKIDPQGIMSVLTEENKKYIVSIIENKGINFTSILVDDKILLFIENGNIIEYDIKSNKLEVIKKYDTQKQLPTSSTSYFKHILINDNTYYITTDYGLLVFDDSFQRYKLYKHNIYDHSSICSDNVNITYVDHSDVLWVGTEKGGISYTDLNNTNFESFYNIPNDPNTLPYNDILAIHEDHQDNLWFGTFSNGILRYNKQTQKYTNFNINTPNQKGMKDWFLANARILQDKNNNMYFMFWGNGFYKLSAAKNKNFGADHLLFENLHETQELEMKILPWCSRDAIIDKKENLWIVSYCEGLQKTNMKTGKSFKYVSGGIDSNKIAQTNMWCIFEDSKGRKWVGTNDHGAFAILDDSLNIKNYNKSTPAINFPASHIKCVNEDAKGIIWFGTGGNGIVGFDPEKEKVLYNYSLEDGLSSNTIYAILIDKNQNMWLTSDNGLIYFDTKNKKFVNYLSSDGLVNEEYSFNSAYISRSGKFFVGGNKGFSTFDPMKIKNNSKQAIPMISQFKVNNKIVSVNVPVNGNVLLTSNINETKKIRLTRRENNFSFILSAMHFADVSKNQISYILDGYSNEWVTLPATNAEATFSNLPGGTYTLKIKASNAAGMWNDSTLDVQITIVPNFYETWWFYTLLLMTVGGGVYLYIKDKDKTAKANKQYLEKEIEERTSQVLKQNEELLISRQNEAVQKWITEGLAMLSQTLNKSQTGLENTCQKILKELIQYTHAASGMIFIVNKDTDEPYLTPYALYGAGQEVLEHENILLGEGLIGQAYLQKEWIILDNPPDKYFEIRSGLGSASPQKVLIIPIRSENIVVGVLELAFFADTDEKLTHLIEKFIETFALYVNNMLLAEKTNKLLAETENKSLNSLEQEEELRQNLEELAAIQEEMQRKEKLYLEKIKRYERDLV